MHCRLRLRCSSVREVSVLADHERAELTSAEPAQPADRPASFAAWERVIVDLEAIAQSARFGLVTRSEEPSSAGEWRPPVGPGPIPADLLNRARAVLVGHFDLIERIEKARDEAGAHISALRSAQQSRPSDRSVYLDVTG